MLDCIVQSSVKRVNKIKLQLLYIPFFSLKKHVSTLHISVLYLFDDTCRSISQPEQNDLTYTLRLFDLRMILVNDNNSTYIIHDYTDNIS